MIRFFAGRGPSTGSAPSARSAGAAPGAAPERSILQRTAREHVQQAALATARRTHQGTAAILEGSAMVNGVHSLLVEDKLMVVSMATIAVA